MKVTSEFLRGSVLPFPHGAVLKEANEYLKKGAQQRGLLTPQLFSEAINSPAPA